jgi:hypothetical protein
MPGGESDDDDAAELLQRQHLGYLDFMKEA